MQLAVVPKNITWGLILDPQNLEDSCNIDSFIDSTFGLRDQETKLEIKISKLILEQGTKNCEELNLAIAEIFLGQETENNDKTDIEILKLISAIGQEEKKGEQIQKEESNTPSISPCASPSMLFFDEVSGILLSSASGNPRSEGSDTEKCLENEIEFQFTTIDLSIEALNSEKAEKTPSSDRLEIIPSSTPSEMTPSSQQLGRLPSIVSTVKMPLVGPAQAQPPQLSLPVLSSLLVTIPLSLMPPVPLSLNLTPVSMPNRGTVLRAPAPIGSGPPPNVLPIPQAGSALLPLLQLNVFLPLR